MIANMESPASSCSVHSSSFGNLQSEVYHRRSFGRTIPCCWWKNSYWTSTDHLGCINTWKCRGYRSIGTGFYGLLPSTEKSACEHMLIALSQALCFSACISSKWAKAESLPINTGQVERQYIKKKDIVVFWCFWWYYPNLSQEPFRIKLTEVAANHGEKLHTILYTQALYFKTDLNVCIKYRKLRKIELAVISSCYR